MADIIDINVNETVEEVTINVVNDVIQVNINKVTSTAGVPYVGATQDVNLGEFGLLTGNIELDNTPTNIPTTAGSIYWNDADGTADLILKGGNVKLQLGQEQVIRVVNKTATNVNLLESNYQAVRVTGAQGQRLKVDLAQATNDILSAETIGLVTENINNNQEGFITTSGLVRNINTTGSLQGETWADGDILYLSPTTAGRITKVKPSAPSHLVVIGYVIHAHATQGSIFVKVDNGYELDELHNVKITTPLNNESLVYNSTLEVWENKSIDLQSVLTEGNRPQKYINDFTPYEFIAEDKGKLLINGDGESMTLNADIFSEGDTLLIIAEPSDIQIIQGSGVNIYGNLGVPSNHTLRVGEMAMLTKRELNFWQLNIVPQITSQTIPQTTSFTAEVDLRYTANGTLTVTDPTPIANKGFIVHVIGGSVTIGGVAYTSGALVYRYYNGTSWVSTNMNNAITIDATPTDGSSNAVSSNGVFDALALKQDDLWNFKNKGITFVDDFITGGISNLQYSGNLIYVSSGAGANALNSNTYPNRTNQEGVVGLNTGTTNTGSSAIRSDVNNPPLFIGNGAISYEVYINVETLSDATNRFYNLFGFIGNAVANNTTNGIFFLYDEGGVVSGNSANTNWKCVTINAGTRTFTTTSVAITASAWVKLRIEINANATSVGFFINNVLVATNTTNIPTTSTPITIFNGNIKTIGTTSRITYIDYIAFRKIFNSTR